MCENKGKLSKGDQIIIIMSLSIVEDTYFFLKGCGCYSEPSCHRY